VEPLIEIQDALLVAVHEHSRAADTLMLPVPPLAANEVFVPPRVTWHFVLSGAVADVCVVVEQPRIEKNPSVSSNTTGDLPIQTATRERNAHCSPTRAAGFC